MPGQRIDIADTQLPNRPTFPWYDSVWLTSYVQAREFLLNDRPDVLDEFERALSVFRTDPTFEPVRISAIFDAAVIDRIRSTIADYTIERLEVHELARFGRLIVHDDPYFLELQREVTSLVGDIVGEPVEPSYNFLSLYEGSASCEVHMDAPNAKWTLDICIDQSREWPIHISDVEPWPEAWVAPTDGDWEQSIREQRPFRSYAMKPGEALIFGGSSQWHVRDVMPNATPNDYCTLLFFHFVPANYSLLSRPENWAEIFGVPELASFC